jgi:ABC-type Fe3+-hydroxamate transport system substrate-binding protein
LIIIINIIRRAKELLHISSNRLSDIARQVGYQDEHYFSRRFKQTVGLSPRQYVTNRRHLGISVTYPELLYSLGVTPIAAPICHDSFPSYLTESFKNVMQMNDARWPDYETIRSLRPDLILAPAWKDEQNYEALSSIAPTVLLPEREDWRDELRDMADILGKRKEAEQVIQAYETKVAAAREQLCSIVGDESVVYLRVAKDETVVYGTHSSRGKMIHQELGLKSAKALLNVKTGVTLSKETLRTLNIDHIILHIDPQERRVQEMFEQWSRSDLWRELTAVKKKQIYPVGSREWYKGTYNFTFYVIIRRTQARVNVDLSTKYKILYKQIIVTS